jgi:hypothetical protein
VTGALSPLATNFATAALHRFSCAGVAPSRLSGSARQPLTTLSAAASDALSRLPSSDTSNNPSFATFFLGFVAFFDGGASPRRGDRFSFAVVGSVQAVKARAAAAIKKRFIG